MKKFFFTIFLLFFPQINYADTHKPEAFIKSIKNNPEAGKKVYLQFCASCHAKKPLIPLGAPRIGIKEDWQYREKNLKQMLKKVAEGFNNMPARGGCFECSDELLKAATLYILLGKK